MRSHGHFLAARSVVALAVVCCLVAPAALADNVQRAINDIRNTTDARRAGEIYASVARSAPDNAELRDVYMRKMLSLGRADKAFGPARALVKLDPSNGVAWAVVGCKSTSTTEAFSATVRAAALLAGDANVMGNLGQLVCWYEHQPEPPKVDAEVTKIFEANREAWAKNEAFKTGFERREKGYDAHQKAIKDVEKAMEKTKADVEEIEGELERVEENMAECRARIKELEEEIRSYWGIGPGGPSYGSSKAKAEVTRQRTRLNELSSEKKELIRQGKKCAKKFKKQEAGLAKLKRDEKGAMREAGAEFKLGPPACEAAASGDDGRADDRS